MWVIFALLSAIISTSQWSIVRASHQKIPSNIMTAAHHMLGPFLAAGVFLYPMPMHLGIVIAYLLYIFLVNPPFSLLATYAVQRIPISLSQPLTSVAIISSTLMGLFIFKTDFPLTGFVGIIIGFLGLWMLYHARWSEWTKPYPWILTVCVLNFGIMSTLASQALKVYPHPLIVSGIGITGALCMSLPAAILHRKRVIFTWNKAGVLLFVALSSLVGEMAMLTALSMTPAAYAISTKRVSIIMGALVGYFIFKERHTPLWRLLAASLLVTIAVVCMTIK